MKDFVAIDFETANKNRSSICSLGIVIVENGEIIDKIYRLVRPSPNFYSYWNTQIHGITFHDTCEQPEFPDVWYDIKHRIDGFPFVAHNSPFDEGCLKAVHDLYGMTYPGYKFHCTCRSARKAYPHLINHKLGTVAEYIGFDLHNHHHALADAEACAEIAKLVIV
ncbi:3'-5' exonuclease [Odoribacter sp. OttesenSCG-928-L07]|nr:3'-5' exonuclease [Odoribacter sp. OttesenSCG-928-L07]MDL2238771.1 3'-5' exonuclease [Bacteroidales bacterium OttesenSCG-928-L14]MDL2241192.1 3'-5' exonuclease [Bacteroidales bacterium OttesenSCG-928-K22]